MYLIWQPYLYFPIYTSVYWCVPSQHGSHGPILILVKLAFKYVLINAADIYSVNKIDDLFFVLVKLALKYRLSTKIGWTAVEFQR